MHVPTLIKGLFHCVHRTFPEVCVCVCMRTRACMCVRARVCVCVRVRAPHVGICFSLFYSLANVCLYVFVTVVARHEAELCDFEKRLKEQVSCN